MLLGRCTVSGNDTFEIDDLELTGLRFATEDVESCVIEFGLGCPNGSQRHQ